MTKEEAEAKGVKWNETIHSMKRRCQLHDYHLKGTYMLTLVVNDRKPLFGALVGDKPDNARIELSELGKAIKTNEIKKISRFYPMVEVWQLCVMPDHLHIILRVKEDMPAGKTLGSVVRGFKTGCSRAWWQLAEKAGLSLGGSLGGSLGEANETVAAAAPAVSSSPVAAFVSAAFPPAAYSSPVAAPVSAASPAEAPSSSSTALKPLLFEPGYNDKILLHPGQLDNWKHYLSDNPRRLLVKRQNPHLFTVLHDMDIAGRKCQIVGNRFLLNIPDKVAVIVHRRYTDEERATLREQWLACGERGGVLVSAAIAPAEKDVLREAMNRGYSIITLRENGFPQFYKPVGEAFDRCSAGMLLQISPWEHHMEQKTITREQCLTLNAIAETIAQECANL